MRNKIKVFINKPTENDLESKEEVKNYLENKNVHDRLFKQSLKIESKREKSTKRLDEERGIVFKPKINNYPLPESKRKPLYVNPYKTFKRQ